MNYTTYYNGGHMLSLIHSTQKHLNHTFTQLEPPPSAASRSAKCRKRFAIRVSVRAPQHMRVCVRATHRTLPPRIKHGMVPCRGLQVHRTCFHVVACSFWRCWSAARLSMPLHRRDARRMRIAGCCRIKTQPLCLNYFYVHC